MNIRSCFLVLLFSSNGYSEDFTVYIGDSNQYQAQAVSTDSAGNTYVTGGRMIQSSEAPADISYHDVFVTKLDPRGNILFTTTFGGKGDDMSNAIAVDLSGNIWIGGTTTSPNFPLRNALQDSSFPINPAGGTGFLAKLSADGAVVYSSYFGGELGNSSVNGLATDQDGNIYVTGRTSASDFPTTPGLPAMPVNQGSITPVAGAFVTKIDTNGTHIVYSALIAGSASICVPTSQCQLVTAGAGIAIDGSGNAFVIGNDNSTNLPVTAGGARGSGGFALKIQSAGNKLAYLTYLGPNQLNTVGAPTTTVGSAITVDATGNAYLTGSTNDTQFPVTPGAYQTTLRGGASHAFVVKLDSAGARIWATFLGGPGALNAFGVPGADSANSIALNASGDVWLVGSNAPGFPATSSVFGDGYGDFLAELSPDGSALPYSMVFPHGAVGQNLAADSNGILHLTGATGLVSTFTSGQNDTARVLGITNAAAGPLSGRAAPGEVISIFGFDLGPEVPVAATPAAGVFPTSLGGVQVLANGVAIPLLYVSESQINAEVTAPLDPTAGSIISIQVLDGSTKLPDFRTQLDQTIFGVFLNSDGFIAAINQDGTLNSSSNPAKAGSIVSIWGTGFSGASGPPVNGSVSDAANNWCDYCQISIGNVNETVAYAGTAPGLIDGVMQINFMVPAQAGGLVQLNFNELGGLNGNGFLYVSQ